MKVYELDFILGHESRTVYVTANSEDEAIDTAVYHYSRQPDRYLEKELSSELRNSIRYDVRRVIEKPEFICAVELYPRD